MKIKHQNRQKFLAILIISVISVFAVTTAWATLTIVDDAGSVKSADMTMQEQAMVHPSAGKARAPEPSTIALFGTGILSMIISFVRRTYAITKRILDILLSITAVVILSPLFLFTALLIKFTSRGPVFYFQERVGRDGKLFKMYKFRTMKVDAEKGIGAVWAQKNDPRLIPIGGFLRKAHVDEIPQFVNVLRGEMSVVGPRPERPVFVEKLKQQIPDYEKRLAVKPGITGLAQVWHRYDETLADVRKKIKYDLLYIRKFCLWTDIMILLRTVRVVFTGEGAR
jgi:exopolysaccharide biosynthesis polyprenyl glycosylphosphotransferase